MSKDFSIEPGEYGERLVLQATWKDELIDYMLTHKINELNINYARGFIGDALDFLQHLPFLEGLLLLVYNIPDISAIHNLRRLRTLSTSCRDKTPLDFSQFPLLEDCGLDWRPRSQSIFQCKTLKRLFIDKYSDKDTTSFRDLVNMESLSFASGSLNDLTGLRPLRKLKKLGLYRLGSLSSLQGIEDLHDLEALEIGTCRKLTTITEVHKLKNLRRLWINNSDEIDSLRPIEGLNRLEEVNFTDSTNILDGDLSPLTHLPNLTDVRFKDRKHYSLKCEEFPPFNTSSNLRGKALIAMLKQSALRYEK